MNSADRFGSDSDNSDSERDQDDFVSMEEWEGDDTSESDEDLYDEDEDAEDDKLAELRFGTDETYRGDPERKGRNYD